jgi:hypothetical protein
MTEDAIITDVSEEQPINRQTKFDDDYEALIEKRNAEKEPVVEETKPEVPMLELTDDAGNIYKVPTTAKYKAKVDGAEQDVPIEQLARSYQKGASADKRLEEASKALKDIEAKQRELTDKERAFIDSQQVLEQKKESGEISTKDYRATARDLLSALTDEDEDDPEGRIAEILSGLSPRQTVIDTDQIAEKALARIREREESIRVNALEKESLEANKKFEDEYQDVISDPIAYDAAKSLAARKWAERPDARPWEIASEVGNEIRVWKGTVQTPSQQTRQKPVTTPKTVSSRASINTEPKTETRADILAEMKKSRGQPV